MAGHFGCCCFHPSYKAFFYPAHASGSGLQRIPYFLAVCVASAFLFVCNVCIIYAACLYGHFGFPRKRVYICTVSLGCADFFCVHYPSGFIDRTEQVCKAGGRIAYIRSADQCTAETFVVTDIDICIILGNLLENAYEACVRQTDGTRYITVKIHQTGRVLIILVENSYSGLMRKKGGVFLSAKAKNRKGIGLESVVDVTKKYNGIPKIEYDGKIFRVSLLLNGNRK